MARFLLYRGSSLYGSVAGMVEDLAGGLRASGHQVVLLDVTRPDYGARLQQAVASGLDGLIGFTGIGLDLRPSNNLYNQIDRPLASIYLDPLILYWTQVVTPIRRRHVFTTAPGDVPYWRHQIGAPVPVSHLPHAADPDPEVAPVDAAERDIPILVAGTAPPDPAGLRAAWAGHGPLVEGRLAAMLAAHDADPDAPILAVIAQHGAPAARLDDPPSLHPYASTLDLYLRARVRWRTAHALLGLPTWFVGPGWADLAGPTPGAARFLGEQPAATTRALMRRARLVVNTVTAYHGSHERVFQALAAGAVPLSSHTTWLAAEGRVALWRDGLEDPAALAASLLADDGARATRVAAGRDWLAAHHTWRHRAGTIAAALMDSR